MAPPRPHRAARAAVALLALLACSAIAGAAVSSAAVSKEWAVYNAHRASTLAGNTEQSLALKSVLNWPFSTPLRQIQSSNVYTAGNARYRRVVDDMMRGKAVKVVAIGGVATNGSAATNPGTNDYFALFVNYLRSAFPNARIEPVRSAAGLAPSPVVSQCIGMYLPSDADLVLLEMVTNDAIGFDNSFINSHNAKSYELVMRDVLKSSNKPALILTQTMVRGMGNGSTPFYLTPEAPQYAALSSYYGTPVVSMRNALWASGTPNADGLVVVPAVEQDDGSTPLDAGHRSMADMLVYNTQRTVQDLQLLPFGDYDRSSMDNDVPSAAVYSDVTSNPKTVRSNGTCQWVRNISDRACPIKMDQMCGLDYSNRQNLLRTYDENVSTKPPGPNKALIIGVAAGAVGALLLLGACLACCIVKKRRHAERIAAAADARQASKVGKAQQDGIPITASSGGDAA